MNTPQDFAYLWNGSEPGWVLLRTNSQALSLTVRFPASGPTLKEIAAIRSAVPSFGALSAQQAVAALRRKVEVPLGSFESKEGRRLAQKCREHGLTIEAEAQDRSGYLPFNELTNACLVIEDDSLSKRVHEEALARGVPVKHMEA